LRHAARVTAAAAASFILASALGLPQGYWAVITAVVVVQASIGATLGASGDRLIGTGAGALVGALAAWLRPPSHWGELGALAASIALLSYGAAVRPSLKIAPVTAVIMIVGNATSQHGSLVAAGLRVADIALGGVLGILATLFVFPARARDAVKANARRALDDMSTLLTLYARRLLEGDGDEAAITALHDRLRGDLGKVETAVAEASREAAARLTGASEAEAIPRALWRLRNDVIMIGRASSHAWPAQVADRLSEPAAAVLRAQAEALRSLSAAFADGAAPAGAAASLGGEAFREAFERLEAEVTPADLSFERLEQVFGLAYAFQAFSQHVADLDERVTEFQAGRKA